MLKTFCIALLLLTSGNVYSQTQFQKTYGFTSFVRVTGMQVTQTGGYALAAVMDYHSIILKLDWSGQVLFAKEIENIDTYNVESLELTDDGGFILCAANREFPGSYDLHLLRMDSSGNVLWTKAFGGWGLDQGMIAKQTSDGGFIACGTNSDNAIRTYVVKTDASGNLEWTKTFSDSIQFISNNVPNDIVQTSDHGYLICGEIRGTGSAHDSYIIKTDAFGNMIWNRIYQYPEWNSFQKLKITPEGDILLAGWIDVQEDSLDSRKMSFVKTDSLGNVMWAKAYTSNSIDLGTTLDISTDGSYLLAGAISINSTSASSAVLQTDSAGTMINSAAFPVNVLFMTGNIIRQNNNGGFAVATTMKQGNQQRLFLIKTDDDLITGCSQSIPNLSEIQLNLQTRSAFYSGSLDSTQSTNITTSAINPTTSTFCFTDDIAEHFTSVNLLFPNPAADYLNTSLIASDEIRLFDLNGKFISILPKSTHVDISNLSSGIYFLRAGEQRIRFVKM